MEAERSSEMWVSISQTTRWQIPEDKSSKLITTLLKQLNYLKFRCRILKCKRVFSRLEVIINLITLSKFIYFCVEMEKKLILRNICQLLYVWLRGKFQNVYKLLVR